MLRIYDESFKIWKALRIVIWIVLLIVSFSCNFWNISSRVVFAFLWVSIPSNYSTWKFWNSCLFRQIKFSFSRFSSISSIKHLIFFIKCNFWILNWKDFFILWIILQHAIKMFYSLLQNRACSVTPHTYPLKHLWLQKS